MDGNLSQGDGDAVPDDDDILINSDEVEEADAIHGDDEGKTN